MFLLSTDDKSKITNGLLDASKYTQKIKYKEKEGREGRKLSGITRTLLGLKGWEIVTSLKLSPKVKQVHLWSLTHIES